MRDLISRILDKIFSNRQTALIMVMMTFAVILLARLFVLQIIRGEEYQSNYDLKIERTDSIDATRGKIYDRNGKLLAYNKLSYAVTIKDSGDYQKQSEHYAALNAELYEMIENIEARGDSVDDEFGIRLKRHRKAKVAATY